MAAINAEVRPFDGEPPERLLKRFTKKCRKEGFMSEVFERRHHRSKSQKQRAKRAKNEYLRRKKQRR
jgi:ribosomal protein S21